MVLPFGTRKRGYNLVSLWVKTECLGPVKLFLIHSHMSLNVMSYNAVYVCV